MNKQLTQDEIDQCMSEVKAPPMTRYEKLMRLAKAIRAQSQGVAIFHRIEYMAPHQLMTLYHPLSAFQLALNDPKLVEGGLKPDLGSMVSVAQGKDFFELTTAELHEFSCDCGGGISNESMAQRVERLAGHSTRMVDSKSWTG